MVSQHHNRNPPIGHQPISMFQMQQKFTHANLKVLNSGRERPVCSLCRKSRQTCFYREGPLKPGPKLGSKQGNRKRARTGQARSTIGEDEDGQDNDSAGMVNLSHTSHASGSQMMSGQYGQESGLLSECNFDCAPTRNSLATATPRPESLDMHDLSSIVHPSHEPTFDICENGDKETFSNPAETIGQSTDLDLITFACKNLDLSSETLNVLIDSYFTHMTSFSLFRPSQFQSKLASITSQGQLTALLAAMFTFSARFVKASNDQEISSTNNGQSYATSQVERFSTLSQLHIDQAFRECGDSRPTLVLLQALALSTFQQLIKGARGLAWRSLGTCVRVAYELDLHLVDSDDRDEDISFTGKRRQSWCLDEEKRRIWWAIWEMDTFASTVRRCPTAIDWSQNETKLPIDDEFWFRDEFRQSCYLGLDAMTRWRDLQECENKSAKAWFIVVNSMMRQAQQLSHPTPRPVPVSALAQRRSSMRVLKTNAGKTREEISESLGVLENALHCFSMALPSHLKYHHEKLSFPVSGSGSSLLMLQSSIYSIYVMMQLTKFMMYHHAVFGGGRREHCQVKSSAENILTPPSEPINPSEPDPDGLTRYAEAADDILMIVSRSSSHHVQYVNPFLASTIWLAAAVQLVYKFFGCPGANQDLTESKFEVLRLNYMQFVEHWKTSTTLQGNLEILKKSLDFIHARKTLPQPSFPRSGSSKRKQIATISNMASSEEVNTSVQALSSDEANNSWIHTEIPGLPVHLDHSASHDTHIEQTRRLDFGQLAGLGDVDENFEDFMFDTGVTMEMDLGMAYDINNFLQAQLS
ncbi:uncharacterized protein PAC_19154 [Phialocephala subalpina]|uniref:Xylanolytic transcriptional activator regulatory domain-containing protein n=1 Tax=Phialocephala subalpina TaxID=576137 RepID=A0A1L7XW43_9HELO|nr:uncharacterized protein PAC_19154 [Phialocephala subalpina]